MIIKKVGDLSIEELRTIIDERLDKKVKEAVNSARPGWVDEIIGELKTTREEQVLLGGRQSEHSDQLEDHEERLQTLEATSNVH